MTVKAWLHRWLHELVTKTPTYKRLKEVNYQHFHALQREERAHKETRAAYDRLLKDFIESNNIRGAALGSLYRPMIDVRNLRESRSPIVRIDLKPNRYSLSYALMPGQGELYLTIDKARKLFLEDTARKFADYIMETLPGELDEPLRQALERV